MNRYRNMPADLHRKDWTFTAARHMLPRRHRATIIWISRRFCGAKPPEVCYRRTTKKVPALAAGTFVFGPRRFAGALAKQLIINE
jgi:hypothetical protein